MRPPRLATATLVRSGELFGIAEGTTRVALSRMVAAGELEADGDGYRLAGHLRARQDRQDASRAGATRRWDGTWRTEVVTARARPAASRAELRAAAGRLRLAELREGVWMRPANLAPGEPADEAAVAGQCRSFASRPSDDPATLAADLWDLDGWAARAQALRRRLAELQPDLDRHAGESLAPAFVASAAVLRHMQADPLLPRDLLPPGWPGAELRADYERYDAAFTAVWRDWYRARR
ncbi:MAG: PaaX domain-containing protein, C- domain protein [Actinobacteria bacterium]|nr:PaaX domain-containing protein, C- domain protein [Actinomycetota bacterium]